MKYVILHCEDTAAREQPLASLLEGSRMSHLQQLAQAGAAGLIRPPEARRRLDPLQLHRGLLGLSAQDRATAPAWCYAASSDIQVAPGEHVWCCELLTQHDGVVVDATAGHIPTAESRVLIQALDEQLGADNRRWEVGLGSHHMLVTSDPALSAGHPVNLPSAAQLLGQRWEAHLSRASEAEALRLLIQGAAKVLAQHPINRVRLDLGENPANALWLWGAASQEAEPTLAQRTGRSGAIVSSQYPLRGLSRLLGYDWQPAPSSFEEPVLHGFVQTLLALVEHRDVVYVHLQVNTIDPVERQCAMERLDQVLLKPLREQLAKLPAWRLLTVVADRRTGALPLVGIGTGVTARPAAALHGIALEESAQIFRDGHAVAAWFLATDTAWPAKN